MVLLPIPRLFNGLLNVVDKIASVVGGFIGSIAGVVGKSYSFVNSSVGNAIDSVPLGAAANSAPLTGGGGSQKTEINAPITINPSAGMDEEAIGSAVVKKLDERERGAVGRVNLSLADMGFA